MRFALSPREKAIKDALETRITKTDLQMTTLMGVARNLMELYGDASGKLEKAEKTIQRLLRSEKKRQRADRKERVSAKHTGPRHWLLAEPQPRGPVLAKHLPKELPQ